jgi:prevent-host-death family protein
MTEVGIKQAKNELSQLFEKALKGEEVIITRNGRERLRLVPDSGVSMPKGYGKWRDKLKDLPEDYWTNPKYDEEIQQLFESDT